MAHGRVSAPPVPRILVADDQPDVLAALRLLLRTTGFEADVAASVQAVCDSLCARPYDLLLMDLNYARDTTSGREGLDLLAEVHQRDQTLPIIVMTGWGTIETAVEAMRRGARSFVIKPWDNTALSDAVRREIADSAATREAHASAARERSQAQLVQRWLLPSTLPELPGFDMAVRWEPASAFGGDCYDARLFEGSRIALSIADVAGKGLGAALLMSHLQAWVRACAEDDPLPSDVAARVNRSLCRNTGHGKFVTLFYAVLDRPGRTVRYCNAGHNAPVVVHADGSHHRLATGGMPLGLFSDAAFTLGEAPLEPGDCLVLFTDGITESTNAEDAEFGDARLIDLVQRHRHDTPAMLVDRIMDAVHAFSHRHLRDDATVICVRETCGASAASHTPPSE